MRMGKKLRAALERRRRAFEPRSVGGHKRHVPGSQNRKKGYGVTTGRRR